MQSTQSTFKFHVDEFSTYELNRKNPLPFEDLHLLLMHQPDSQRMPKKGGENN